MSCSSAKANATCLLVLYCIFGLACFRGSSFNLAMKFAILTALITVRILKKYELPLDLVFSLICFLTFFLFWRCGECLELQTNLLIFMRNATSGLA